MRLVSCLETSDHNKKFYLTNEQSRFFCLMMMSLAAIQDEVLYANPLHLQTMLEELCVEGDISQESGDDREGRHIERKMELGSIMSQMRAKGLQNRVRGGPRNPFILLPLPNIQIFFRGRQAS